MATLQVMLPNNSERRQIFHSLRRWSSFTAWNRVLDFYQALANAAEASVREASAKGLEDKTSLPESDYLLILKGLAAFEEGVDRLRHGDKRVFRCHGHGCFVMTSRQAFDNWWDKYRYIQSGDIGVHVETTPNWPQFLDCTDRSGGRMERVLSRHHRGPRHAWPNWHGAARIRRVDSRATGKNVLPSAIAGSAQSIETATVRTGRDVPCSGIWEPVDIRKRKFMSLLNSATPKGPATPVGCMNYLHEGSSAPKAALETLSDNLDVDTTWQLLWRDDRYLDGTIPAEESGYSFLRPEKACAQFLEST